MYFGKVLEKNAENFIIKTLRGRYIFNAKSLAANTLYPPVPSYSAGFVSGMLDLHHLCIPLLFSQKDLVATCSLRRAHCCLQLDIEWFVVYFLIIVCL